MRSVRAEVEQNAPKQSPRRGPGRARLEAYLAVGVSSLGLASSASAGVISINVDAIKGANAGLSAGGYKDHVFGPGTLRLVKDRYYKTGLYPLSSNMFIAYTPYTLAAPTKFLAGESVDSSFVFGQSYNMTPFKAGPFKSQDFQANNYIGFKSQVGDDLFYGYIEVTWDFASETFEIISAAYEDSPNVAIQTPSGGGGGGGGGEVPEPASGAIAALLMGGTALRQWRKKRRQESNEAVAS